MLSIHDLKQIGAAGSLRIIGMLLTLVIGLTMARLLGPKEFGTYSFITGLAIFGSVLGSAGLDKLIVKKIATVSPNSANGEYGRLVTAATMIVILVSTVVALLLLMFAWLSGIAYVYGWPLILMSGFLTISFSLFHVPRSVLEGQGNAPAGQFAEFIVRRVSLLIGIGLLGILGMLSSATTATILAAISTVLALIFAWWASKSIDYKQKNPFELRRFDFIWMAPAGWIFLVGFVDAIMLRSGIIFIGIMSGPEEAGQFALAFRIAIIGSLGLVAGNMVLAPKMARALEDGNIDATSILAGKSAVIGGLTAVFLTLGVLVGWEYVLFAVGESYRFAFTPAIILASGYIVSGLAGPVTLIAILSGQERLAFIGSSISALIAVSLALVLIRPLGATGAATAFAVSLGVNNVILAIWDWKRLGINTTVWGSWRKKSTAINKGRY